MSVPIGHEVDADTVEVWRFDEASGGAAGVKGLNLPTVGGTPSSQVGQVGGSRGSAATRGAYFKGTCPPAVVALLNAGNYTLEFLPQRQTYIGADNYEVHFCVGDTTHYWFQVYSNTGTNELRIYWTQTSGFLDLFTGITLPLATTQHVAFSVEATGLVSGVYTTRTVRAYANGVLIGTYTGLAPCTAGTGAATISWLCEPTGASYSNGSIDDSRLSSKVRTADEIRSSYARIFGLVPASAPLLADGIPLPLAFDGATENPQQIGEGRVRAQSGAGRDNFIAEKNGLKGHLIPQTLQEATAWRCFLNAGHDHARFDSDLYTDKGFAPSTSTAATQGSGGRYGGKVSLGATTGVLAYSGVWGLVGSRAGGTALVAQYNGSSWDDHFVSWDAEGNCTAVVKNAAVQATTFPSWLSVDAATGKVTLSNTTGSPVLYDELTLWAFEAPLVWAYDVFTFRAGQAMPLAPAVKLSGRLVLAPWLALGKVGQARMLAGVLDAAVGFDPSLRQLDVDLEEQ